MSGKPAKNNAAVWNESDPESCDNIEKELCWDTGGSKGAIPKSILRLAKLIRKAPTSTHAAVVLSRKLNKIQVAKRVSIMRRTVKIKCKSKGQSFQQYERILAKKTQKTQRGTTKLPVRRLVVGEA